MAQPSTRVYLTLSTAAGLLMDRSTSRTMPTAGAGLRVSWRVGRFFVVGLTGNGQAGSAGQFLTAQAWASADQWL